jgi:hypothetical protein
MMPLIANKNIQKASYCHSGLSGIFPVNSSSNPGLKKDSGQAGMTELSQCGYTSKLFSNPIVFNSVTTKHAQAR